MFDVQQIRDGYYFVPSRSRCAGLFSIHFYGFHSIGQIINTLTCCIERAAQWHRHRLIKMNASDLRKAKRNKFLLKIESFLIGSDCDRFLSLGFVSCEILHLQNLFSFSPRKQFGLFSVHFFYIPEDSAFSLAGNFSHLVSLDLDLSASLLSRTTFHFISQFYFS